MTALLVLAAIAFAVLLRGLFTRMRALEARVAELEIAEMRAIGARAPVAPPPPRMTERDPLTEQATDDDDQSAPPPRPWDRVAEPEPLAEPQPAIEREPAVPLLSRLEGVIGGRLPIWIGGAALVLAAFFLVRYSIEQGLLGPRARSIIAALFGLALVAASEAARRLPATRADPRIGQALAGAGIAILYGTLYMAAELYGLLGAGSAFALMVAITLAALGLSLRHGPPTALMGLIGGFAAPLVAGIDGANVAPLLIYLALFTAGLFALAIHRGWLWLALLATGGGLLWPLLLLGFAEPGALPFVGLFVFTLALAATLALPRAGAASGLLRLAPLVIGLIQLVLIAPALSFTPLAWGLYALLGAAALWLAWRDPKLVAGAAAATGLMLALLAIGLFDDADNARMAALGFTLLFGGAGHALSRRERTWALVALAGTAGPALLVLALSRDLPEAPWRALIAALPALACAWLSWRHHDRAGDGADLGLVGGAGAAALLGVIAALQPVDAVYAFSIVVVAAIALALWAAPCRDRWLDRLALFALAAAMGPPLIGLLPMLAQALAGSQLPFPLLPSSTSVLRELGAPGLVVAAGLTFAPGRWNQSVRKVAAALAALGLAAALYTLAKQPLAIATPERFIEWGFVERALITQALFGAALALMMRVSRLHGIGVALFALALFRMIWFDLALLNPLAERQSVGSLPILNAAVTHLALAAIWTRIASHAAGDEPAWSRALRIVSLTLVALAVAAAVRQFIHGQYLDAPALGITENYLYSAAFLALAIGWLARGIMTGARDLRLIGLALLTLVTLKVFLIDAAALTGLLRILSFLGLGLALIAIGWAYGRFLARPAETA